MNLQSHGAPLVIPVITDQSYCATCTMIRKVTYLWQGHCGPLLAKTMAQISIRFDPRVTLSIVAPELSWYPTKGRSNAADKLYLINLICIDSLGLYAKARYLFEPRAVFFCLATDQPKSTKKKRKKRKVLESEREKKPNHSPAAGKTDETGKIQPCSVVVLWVGEWWEGEVVISLPLISMAQTREGQC